MSVSLAFSWNGNLRERCEIGSVQLSRSGTDYDEGAVVPVGDWRPLNAREAQWLQAETGTTRKHPGRTGTPAPAGHPCSTGCPRGHRRPLPVRRPLARRLPGLRHEPCGRTHHHRRPRHRATPRPPCRQLGPAPVRGPSRRPPPALPEPRPRNPLPPPRRPGHRRNLPSRAAGPGTALSAHRRREAVRRPGAAPARPAHPSGTRRRLHRAHRTPAARRLHFGSGAAVHRRFLAGPVASGDPTQPLKTSCLAPCSQPWLADPPHPAGSRPNPVEAPSSGGAAMRRT